MPSQFLSVLGEILVQDPCGTPQWCDWNPMGGFVVTGARDIKEACGLRYLVPLVEWPSGADYDHGIVRVLKKCARRQIAGTRSMPAKDLAAFIEYAYVHQPHEAKNFVCNLRDVDSLKRMLDEKGWKGCQVFGCKSAPKRTIFALPGQEFLGISPFKPKTSERGIGIFNPNTVVAVRRVGAWPWDQSEDDDDSEEEDSDD